MKHISVNKKGLFFAVGCIFALATTTSCINETLDACPSHKLTVKVTNVMGDDITTLDTNGVNEAAVYIFDESFNHLSTSKMSRADVMGRRKIDLNYPAGKKLYAVAWGNAFGGAQNVTEGAIIEQLKVMLKSENEVAEFPDELFHGNTSLVTKAEVEETVDTVSIVIKVGKVRLMTENMPAAYLDGLRAGKPIELSINKTLDTYDYQGTLIGDSVLYTPPAMPNTEAPGEMTTGFQTLAAGAGLRASFVIEGVENKLAIEDAEGKSINSSPLNPTTVIFQWDGQGNYIGIKVIVHPWGYIDDNHEF